MSALDGDRSFIVALTTASWTQLVPNPADSSIPKAAAIGIRLQNAGSATMIVVKAADAGDLPAATEAAGRAFAGLVKVIEPSSEFTIPAPVGGFPDIVRCSNYYALPLNDGDTIIVTPVN